MAESFGELLDKIFPSPTNLSKLETGLLDACLAWHPGMMPLKDDLRVQAYLQSHPDGEITVNALQVILTLTRRLNRTDQSPDHRVK